MRDVESLDVPAPEKRSDVVEGDLLRFGGFVGDQVGKESFDSTAGSRYPVHQMFEVRRVGVPHAADGQLEAKTASVVISEDEGGRADDDVMVIC